MSSTRTVVFRLALAWLLWAWAGCAVALDPALDISQYAHTAWRIRDGFAKGSIRAIAQTPDGYLWLGTDFGLLRFDGVQAVPWQPPAGQPLPDQGVQTLAAARDGTLWIGTRRGLATWNGHQLITYPRFDGFYIAGILQDREGTIWVAARKALVAALVCTIRAATAECQGADGTFGTWTGALYEDSRAALWLASDKGMWRLRPGPPKLFSIPGGVTGSFSPLVEDATGAMLVAGYRKILRLEHDKLETWPLPTMGQGLDIDNLVRDRDGAIWIGTLGAGLLHAHDHQVDAFTQADGLSGNVDPRVFEDREGSIWVVTAAGIDRFRAMATATYSTLQGLSGLGASVAAGADGSFWIGTTTGLHRWHDGRMSVFRPRSRHALLTGRSTPASFRAVETVEVDGLPEPSATSLFLDRLGRLWLGSRTSLGFLERDRFVSVSETGGFVDSIVQDGDGALWIARRDAGLQKVSGDRIVQQFPWADIARSGPAWRLAIDPVRGGVWLGFFLGGIARVVDGRVRESYSTSDGLGQGHVNHIRSDPDGSVWIATEGGLSRLKAGRIATLDAKRGLPCDEVEASVVGADGSTWIYTQCAVVRITRGDLDAWTAAVDGGRPPPAVRTLVLDAPNGALGADHLGSYSPHLAIAQDGKVLFTSRDGVSSIDPRHLPYNNQPPPVHVERVVADRRAYDAASPLRLPPLVRDLEIDYTALSLVAPEFNRFRYKLEGRDPDWQEAGNRRKAFYGDLDPGHYRFRVIASNNSGVWNEQGATLEFFIAPAYWQTNWFRALCVAAFVASLWALYRLRLQQLARRFNLTLEARVNERTRIARDLHDTLLQSFHGLLLRFQTAVELLPARADEARQLLVSAIDQAAEAITEGRDAVQGLRSSAIETNDLASAIRELAEALAVEEGADANVALSVEAQGTPRELHPIVRDEFVRIAAEALRNAARHAKASQIEVEIRYDDRRVRLRVRDDGKGIAPETLKAGAREGHFGMPGMRERTRLVGGEFTVWSGVGAGTEIEVSIPAAQAYAAPEQPAGWRARLASRIRKDSETRVP